MTNITYTRAKKRNKLSASACSRLLIFFRYNSQGRLPRKVLRKKQRILSCIANTK